MKTRLLRNSKLAGGFGLLLALLLTMSLALPVMAVPGTIKYEGNVSVCGNDMPEGTEVAIKVNGVTTDTTTVDENSQYGIQESFSADGEGGDAVQIIVLGQVLHEDTITSGTVEKKVVDLLVRPTLTTASTAGGSVTTPGQPGPFGPYDCGTVVNIVATASGGNVFTHWSGDNATIANPLTNATTITMNGIYSITANFEPEEPVDTCDLTPTSTAGGHVETPGEEGPYPYECGTDATIEAVVDDDCYEFSHWSGDTGTIDDVDAASTTIHMDDDYSITAVFIPEGVEYCLLTPTSTAGGHVETPGEEGPYPYECGTDATIEAVVDDDCYEFSHWSGDTGTIDDVDAASTTILMDDDYSIVANFTKIEYDLSTSSTAGGHVEVPGEPGPYTYDCCTDVPIEAVVDDDCYEFSHWSGDTGTIDDVDAASTTIHMDDDYSIVANFTKIEYDLSTSSTAGGYVEVPGEGDPVGTYDCCTNVPIVAVATGCYNFAYWAGDNATIADPTAASTTIHMDDDYTITAVFELAEELEDIEIPFNEGWNTFSTPISLHDCVDTWGEFVEVNDLTIIMIYGYDAATEAWVPVYDSDEIEPLYGYYVKTAEAGMAHIIPNSHETPLPTRDLIRGVHLIGIAPASLEDTDVVTALVTIYMAANGYEGYTLVVSPYINSPNDWEYARDGGDPPMMSIGRAYWLVMENDDEYVGSTTTPLAP